MRIQINEDNNIQQTWMTLTPETVEEVGILLRLANKAKKEKPYLRTSFYGSIYTDICFKHRTDNKVLTCGGEK